MDAYRKRLLYYLLLNIIVSVCATVAVLFVYDYFYHPVIAPAARTAISQQGAANLEITAAIGAGILGSETVVIRNTGTTPLALNGWKLQDEQANVYNFPNASITSGGAIQVHSASGADTLVDYYWNLPAPVWIPGETATLLDPAGSARSVYKVP